MPRFINPKHLMGATKNSLSGPLVCIARPVFSFTIAAI